MRLARRAAASVGSASHPKLAAALHHIVVHLDVVPVEFDLVAHVAEEAAHEGREVQHMRRAPLLKDGARRREVSASPGRGGAKL